MRRQSRRANRKEKARGRLRAAPARLEQVAHRNVAACFRRAENAVVVLHQDHAERDLLEENGPQLREPYSKHLEDGIFELRAKQGSDITRVLYFFFVGKKIVLTNGFTKKTQKTPRAEITTAKKYRAEYIERKENLS